MDKKLTIILVILAIIVVAIFVFRGRFSTQPTQTPTSSEYTLPTSSEQTLPTSTEQTLPESSAKEFLVEGSEFSFNPSEIEVSAGDEVKVTLRNVGSIQHDMEVHCPGFEKKTKLLKPGEEDTITFTAPENGTCEFYCTVPGHKEQGMKGSLIVR